MVLPPFDNSNAHKGIIRAVLIAAGTVVVLFLLFEIVELVWLQDVDMDIMHTIYVLRGFFISLAAVMLVGWLVVKSSQPLLTTREWVLGERSIKTERLKNFNNWFIVMRWFAIVIAAALVYIVVQVNRWLPPKVLWPLAIAVAGLALLNLFYIYLSKQGDKERYLLQFQVYADLVILTFMLHYSGGIENPLTLMLLIHIIIAGIILSRKHLYAVTTTAILLLIIMAAGEATGFLPHYTLNLFPHFEEHGTHIHAAHMPLYVTGTVGLLVTIFLLTAYFIGTIMNRIRHDEHQLELFADQSLEQRQLIEKALETTNTGLCVCNEQGNPFWTNRIWDDWFGFEAIEEAGCNREKEDAGNARSDSVSLNGESTVREISMEDTGDSSQKRTYQITTAPLIDKDGNFAHTVSLATDVTDQKKAQEQMVRAGRLAAVGELAGKLAHEINNPIAIISAKCRLLLTDRDDEMSETVSDELIKITDAADRVSDIARGLLSYCRPSPSTRTELDLRIPIENALSMIEQNARNNNVQIENLLPESLPMVTANSDEMRQVFMNLFLNALDAMPDGGRLEVSALQTDDIEAGSTAASYLAVTVRDTGTGIPPDIRQQILEPFFTTKEEGKGTGLGLSICAGLIRSHNGNLEIHSKAGKGTRVIIRLPVSSHSEEGR